MIFQRIVLRLPYDTIVSTMEEIFHESISAGTIITILRSFAVY